MDTCTSNYEKLEIAIKKNQGKYCKDLDRPEELQTFLIRYGLLFKITDEVFYLSQVHMLTSFSIIDEVGISRGIDYEKFCISSNASKTFAKKTMHYFQKNLANMSCKFIKKIAQDLTEYNQRQKILEKLQTIDADMRKILPCYEVTKILIEHALINDAAITIIFEKFNNQEKDEKFLFLPNYSKTDFELCLDTSTLAHQPCMVIRGVSKSMALTPRSRDFFIQHINTMGLKNIILANMAKHKQYPSKGGIPDDNPYEQLTSKILTNDMPCKEQLSLLTIVNQEFLIMKKLAENLGCCLDNPSLFLIKHIYCDAISNLFEQSITRSLHESSANTILHQNNQSQHLI